MPAFDLTNAHDRDDDIQPPKLFAPTPTPDILVTTTQTKRTSQENLSPDGVVSAEKDKGITLRNQRIRLEPVRMPIPRLHSATSTSSLPSSEDTTTTSQPQGKKPSALTLKKAFSNVDVAPSSSQGKTPTSKQKSQSTFRAPLKVSALQKNIPPQISSPIRRTASSQSVKNSSPSPSNSSRRGSEQNSPDRKVSGDSHNPSSPASPSDGSEVGSDRDICSPTALSSSSDGEVS